MNCAPAYLIASSWAWANLFRPSLKLYLREASWSAEFSRNGDEFDEVAQRKQQHAGPSGAGNSADSVCRIEGRN
jgi:hypothetical protein